jgi:hypothetical protein
MQVVKPIMLINSEYHTQLEIKQFLVIQLIINKTVNFEAPPVLLAEQVSKNYQCFVNAIIRVDIISQPFDCLKSIYRCTYPGPTKDTAAPSNISKL